MQSRQETRRRGKTRFPWQPARCFRDHLTLRNERDCRRRRPCIRRHNLPDSVKPATGPFSQKSRPTRAAGYNHGAAVEIRTRDLFLTKEVLYLLSYSSKKKFLTRALGAGGIFIIKRFSMSLSTENIFSPQIHSISLNAYPVPSLPSHPMPGKGICIAAIGSFSAIALSKSILRAATACAGSLS